MQAALRLQSPLPEPETACFNQTLDGFTLALFGYVTQPDGTTALTWRVTNANKQDISYVAFGTGGWTPVAPADDGVIPGGLGDYHVEWTNEHGNPGFASIKYETEFDGFSQGAEDIFVMTVSSFDPSEPIQVQMKAGKNKTTFTVIFDGSGCDWSPTPTPTATPESPLPTPTPTVVPIETISDTEVYVLSPSMFEVEMSEAEKEERWRLGLPVPLVNVDVGDEVVVESMAVSTSSHYRKPGLLALVPQTAVQAIDNWHVEDMEDFESGFPNTTGDCAWQLTQRAGGGQSHIWGTASDRSTSGAQALWPAGAVNDDASPGTQPLPPGSTYPTDMITSVICRLSDVGNAKNVLAEFQMWYELADNGDSLSVQFFSGTGDGNGENLDYQGGLEWRGSTDGVVFQDWRAYHIYYPDIVDNGNAIWVKWRFASDNRNNTARGPWLDDLAVSIYEKPQSSANCQNADPTYTSGLSKGLNIGPYTEDLQHGDLAKFDQMIDRLTDSGVNWVRMEFKVNPSYFATGEGGTLDPLNTDGDNHIDLRHYDLFVDSICALNSDDDPNNDIAILGLIDNASLVRQDWYDPSGLGQGNVTTNGYLPDFVDVVEQLARYYDDRIGAWEIWNEPDYYKSGLRPEEYASLLTSSSAVLNTVDANDKVLYTGLVGANRTASRYFAASLASLHYPKPFDIFALHPYFTEEYPGRNGKRAELDPAYYMRGDIEHRPDTIVKKFRIVLDSASFQPDEQGKPIWATEVGWNSAEGSMQCQNYVDLVTTEDVQACYLQRGFHSLYNLSPNVSKVFWFTYHDTGVEVSEEECGNVANATALERVPSPSWTASDFGQYQVRASGANIVRIPWSFGLYRGNIHTNEPEDAKKKPVQDAFTNWPNADINCAGSWPNDLPTLDDLNKHVYLPAAMESDAAASSQ
ncbi:MAG: hypothetical protein KDD92_16100 [Caldilineaceae bacterium]|nr:hypothetical protein [Caldilineaceae bacterium]